ncbi:MAG: ribonuclease R [Atopobiaceae bacterium]
MSRKRPHHGKRRHGNHPKPHKAHQFLTGTIEISAPGIAQVTTAEGTFRVAKTGIREAMNNDEVQVSLVSAHGPAARAGEKVAYVQGVLQRATTTFAGVFSYLDPLGAVVPLDTRIQRDFFVVPQDKSPKELGVSTGDVVVARIMEYPSRTSAGVVTLERRVGSAEELDLGIERIIASYGLPVHFPQRVREEASRIHVDVDAALTAASPSRRDLRQLLCFTIDPSDARDFDDAIGAQKTSSGYEVWVHIADVTHYVTWDSSLDLEARQRTCSVYLVDRVLPMLPEELSCDACSLKPHQDRLAMSVHLTLNRNGEVVCVEAMPSAICSSARLTYDVVDGVLADKTRAHALHADGKMASKILASICMLDEVARLRTRIRHARGALDFDTKEARVELDQNNKPTGVNVRQKTPATSLVEEAMLMANEAVASMLASQDLISAYRVHEPPAPEDLQSCLPALTELDLVKSAERDALLSGSPSAILAVLKRAKETPGEYLANSLLLRAQRRAVYAPHNLGHYALGAAAYCHFTSPIRRYADIMVHRRLKALLAQRMKTPTQRQIEAALPHICHACSERERIADAASRATQKLKMAELFSQYIGEKFSGIVTGLGSVGIFVMLDDTLAEGLVPMRALGGEWFYFDEARQTLTGEFSGKVWRLGQRVAVRVSAIDIAQGHIDFTLAN